MSKRNKQSLLFKTCKEQFDFLTEHSFMAVAGYSKIVNDREVILPKVKTKDQKLYQAKVIYECPPLSIEICLDEEQSRVIFTYACQGKDLFWSDLIAVFNMDDHSADYHNGQAFIYIESKKDLVDAVKCWKEMLIPQLYLMDKTSVSVRNICIDRADKLRKRIFEYAEQQSQQENKHSARELAQKAFLKRDYLRVIEYLKPIEKDITPADRKMLELSIKKIREPFE